MWINDFGPYLPQAEWGGFKRSGIGRELGPSGLAEYQEAKHVYENTAPAAQYWFERRPPRLSAVQTPRFSGIATLPLSIESEVTTPAERRWQALRRLALGLGQTSGHTHRADIPGLVSFR